MAKIQAVQKGKPAEKNQLKRQYKFPWGCKSEKNLGTDWQKKESC